MEDDPASATNQSLDAGGRPLAIEYDGDGYEPTGGKLHQRPADTIQAGTRLQPLVLQLPA
eukprot:scaffold5617_cov70-Cylindrotheca_fusiformis.AAC.3